MKGYTEFVTKSGIGFIVNCFNHILYVNQNWPDGEWSKVNIRDKRLSKRVKKTCKQGRQFNKEELMLELI